MSLISAAVCVGVMSVMSTLETRAVWAMAGREKLRHGINFRFVSELRLQQAVTVLYYRENVVLCNCKLCHVRVNSMKRSVVKASV